MHEIYEESFVEIQEKLEKLTSKSIIGANLKELKKDKLLE